VHAAREFFALLRRTRAHPFKNLASPIFFPPIFLSLFGAVHGLCTTVPALSAGGALWFMDLTQPDPSGVLPVLSALTWLATIELASGKAFHMPPWMLSATRLLAVACIPMTEPLPAGVFMFWLTSNLFAMGRATMLRQRPIARFFRVPPVNRPRDT
jgi:YidC/Oxa1 family membrane protein insertase